MSEERVAGRSRIGRHLPTAGGLEKTLGTAEKLGCETIQVFVSNPQGWAEPPVRPDAEAFAARTRELGLDPVVVHAKYLINLASTDGDRRERAARTLAAELVAAGRIGASQVVVHAGSHGGDGEERGLQRLAGGLVLARELAAEADGSVAPPAEPVVENSVGAGTQLCWSFESLGRVARLADVRVCVDTAHAFVAGYDISTSEGVGDTVGLMGELLDGRVALLHLNDAKNELGSHRDGHRKIGAGRVPEARWAELFAGLPNVPVVMETPYDGEASDAAEVRRVKRLADPEDPFPARNLPNAPGER